MFTPQHQLADLVATNSRILTLLNHLDIPLLFGDKTVQQVCAERGVDTPTFLAIANYLTSHDYTLYRDLNIPALIDYLRHTHKHYTTHLLPQLREQLKHLATTTPSQHLATLTLQLFETYSTELLRHLHLEDNQLFHGDGAGLRLSSFVHQHETINSHLQELKSVIIRYIPNEYNLVEINKTLSQLFLLQEDLNEHTDIENNLLIPALVNQQNNGR